MRRVSHNLRDRSFISVRWVLVCDIDVLKCVFEISYCLCRYYDFMQICPFGALFFISCRMFHKKVNFYRLDFVSDRCLFKMTFNKSNRFTTS